MKMQPVIILIGTVIVLGILFVIIGLSSSRGIQCNVHEIEESFDLTLAQISDTHFDNDFSKEDFDTVIDTMNSSEVDVLLFTGDLFQSHVIEEDVETEIITFLTSLEATYKLAVLGNHDFEDVQEPRNDVVRVLKESGFTILQNESFTVSINKQQVQFIGLDDLRFGRSSYNSVLETIDSDAITFVVAHEPDTFADIKDKDFIAMFSGHSHGGQIRLPIIGDIVNVEGAKLYNEHHYHEAEKDLFISFGLGESAIRIRFFNKRQFEIYDYS